MQIALGSMRQAHSNLPDEVPPGTVPPGTVPPGTSFVFVKEGTGHLSGRFEVGDTV